MLSIAGLPGAKPIGPQMTPMPVTKAQADYNLLYGPWLSDNEFPADAFGRLGLGEIPVPLVDPDPQTPEPVAKVGIASDGLNWMLE